jgi:crossover junction endodeoxyribonuclease RuvC
MLNTVLAFDPGVTGAYAILDSLITLVDDVPVHTAQHGNSAKIRNELDLHGLRTALASFRIAHVFIERVAARPGQGVTSMFRFGEACGAIYGLMVGLRLPVTFVTPQTWQKHHHVGASPDAARQRAVQLYPAIAPMLARKRDQHRADALLLACYGRHTLNGTGGGQ